MRTQYTIRLPFFLALSYLFFLQRSHVVTLSIIYRIQFAWWFRDVCMRTVVDYHEILCVLKSPNIIGCGNWLIRFFVSCICYPLSSRRPSEHTVAVIEASRSTANTCKDVFKFISGAPRFCIVSRVISTSLQHSCKTLVYLCSQVETSLRSGNTLRKFSFLKSHF